MKSSMDLPVYGERVLMVLIGMTILVIVATVIALILQPVAAYDRDDSYLIKHSSSGKKDFHFDIIFFDSLGDCHNYVEQHQDSGLKRDDCTYR